MGRPLRALIIEDNESDFSLLEMALRMLMAFTYLPGFVTLVFRGMPTVWRGRHRDRKSVV